LLFHTQQALAEWFKKQPESKTVDREQLAAHKADLHKRLQRKIKLAKNYFTHISAATIAQFPNFCSIDMRSANFTVLRQLIPGQPDDWVTFVQRFLPMYEDVAPPECLCQSKYFRQFVLGGLPLLQLLWETRTIELLEELVDQGYLEPRPAIICLNSDEIVMSIDDPGEQQQFLTPMGDQDKEQDKDQANSDTARCPAFLDSLLPDHFRRRVFRVEPLPLEVSRGESAFLKRYADGIWRLANVHPCDYNRVFGGVLLLEASQ
jgi:hypothetical protein